MSLTTELQSSTPKVEFILCIEGIGWPGNVSDLSVAFEGDVFVTSDINGTLATDLGCTIHPGLDLPSGVADSFDIDSMVYLPGGVELKVLDVDDFLLTAYAVNSPTAVNTLNGNVEFLDTTIVINEDNFTSVEGDVIWVAGAEAIKLGSKAGSTFSACARGYAGTRRGNYDPTAIWSGYFRWVDETAVFPHNPRWFDRKVIIYMHVPGEARANLVRLYTGYIRDMSVSDLGQWWNISTQGDVYPGFTKHNYISEHMYARTAMFVQHDVEDDSGLWRTPAGTMNEDKPENAPLIKAMDPARITQSNRRVFMLSNGPQYLGNRDIIELASMYHYRNVPGGTKGVYTSILSDWRDPQTYTSSVGSGNKQGTRHHIQCVLNVDGNYVWALYMEPADLRGYNEGYDTIVTEAVSPQLGNSYAEPYEHGAPVSIMLDSYSDSWQYSRFSLGQQVRRNPMDIMLMFLTSMPSEYNIATATGGTASTVTVGFGGASGEWNGYAIHCVDDTAAAANQNFARVIEDWTSGVITVDEDWPSATHNGSEYQVRNTKYDLLPFRWALGVHHTEIDVSSFENVKMKHLSDIQFTPFAIGDERVDIWDLLLNQICVPYGILMYTDRTTGKLSAKYISNLVEQNNLSESYTEIEDREILDIGDMYLVPAVPTSAYEVYVRGQQSVTVRELTTIRWMGTLRKYYRGVEKKSNDVGVTGKGAHALTAQVPETKLVWGKSEGTVKQLSAMFNTRDDAKDLINMLSERAAVTSIPRPTITMRLDMESITNVQVGDILSVTSNRPIDPYTQTRGWTSQLCRVMSTNISFDAYNPGIDVVLEIHEAGRRLALLAPACDVASKGSGAYDYFTVEVDNYSPTGTEDWTGLAPGDLIELRDITGAFKEQEEIHSFGANQSATPEGASTDVINVVGTITSSIVAGDYVTLAPWVTATVTDNMKRFCGLAGSDELLDTDQGREYE